MAKRASGRPKQKNTKARASSPRGQIYIWSATKVLQTGMYNVTITANVTPAGGEILVGFPQVRLYSIAGNPPLPANQMPPDYQMQPTTNANYNYIWNGLVPGNPATAAVIAQFQYGQADYTSVWT